MKTMLIVMLGTLTIWVVAAPPAAPATDEDGEVAAPEAPAATAATGTVEEAATEEAGPEAGPFTKPSVADVANAIRAMSPGAKQDQVMNIANALGLDLRSPRAIDDMFNQMRARDRAVLQRGNSVTTKRVLELARRVPYTRKTSQHFQIMYPRVVTATVQGKTVSKPFDELYPVEDMLNAADTAFRKTTEMLLMSQFMNWGGKVRGRIYLVADPTEWNVIRRSGMANTPVQIVLTEDDTREFFVFVNPMVKDMLDAAISFAVSELVLKEYSMVMAKQQRPRLPVFYITGVAADVAGLNAVITEQGPQQIKSWKGRQITPKDILHLHQRFRKGEYPHPHLPLLERDLNSFDRVVMLTSYPRDDQQIFYHLIQSRALVRYLVENGPLPFVVMSKELADGKVFERVFDNHYVRIRTELTGGSSARTAPDKPERDKKTGAKQGSGKQATPADKPSLKPDDVLKNYRTLRSNAKDAIFLPLTEAYMTADAAQK